VSPLPRAAADRPLLRGVLHQAGFFAALVVGALLVLDWDGARRGVAAAVFAGSGVVPVLLIAAGGIAYTLGGVVYARRKPDPAPSVFGYHELFHALTLVALALQYVAMTFFVIGVV